MDQAYHGTNLSDFAQLSLWSAANLAGVSTAHLTEKQPFFRRMMKKLTDKYTAKYAGSASNDAPRLSNEESLPVLAVAVVGSSRSLIFSAFGPPCGALLNPAEQDNADAAVWESGTWYYPLPQNGPMAMAINFDEDYANGVEFFKMPTI